MRSYLYEWQRRTFWFSFSTRTEAWVTSQWGHKHTNNINESVSPFNLSKTILVSYTHRNVKVFTATHQNKSFLLRPQQKYLFSRMYILLLLLLKLWKLYFLRNDHTTFLTWFNFNCKFLLFAKNFIFNNFKINEIDVLCLSLRTRYTTQTFWGKINHLIWLF